MIINPNEFAAAAEAYNQQEKKTCYEYAERIVCPNGQTISNAVITQICQEGQGKELVHLVTWLGEKEKRPLDSHQPREYILGLTAVLQLKTTIFSHPELQGIVREDETLWLDVVLRNLCREIIVAARFYPDRQVREELREAVEEVREYIIVNAQDQSLVLLTQLERWLDNRRYYIAAEDKLQQLALNLLGQNNHRILTVIVWCLLQTRSRSVKRTAKELYNRAIKEYHLGALASVIMKDQRGKRVAYWKMSIALFFKRNSVSSDEWTRLKESCHINLD